MTPHILDPAYSLTLNSAFEYGILPLINSIDLEGQLIDLDTLLYLPCGQSTLSLRMQKGSRALTIGGEPFNEDIFIWWNFVARTKEEIAEAVHAWNHHDAFGEVAGYPGDRLTAPPLTLDVSLRLP